MMLIEHTDRAHPASSYGVDTLVAVEVLPIDQHVILLLDRTALGHAAK